LRAFVGRLRSATWLATVAIVSVSGSRSCRWRAQRLLLHRRSLLIWLVSIDHRPRHRVSRLFAGWAVAHDPRRPAPSSRPRLPAAQRLARGTYGAARTWAEREFTTRTAGATSSVLILLPLRILEFVVAIGLWLVAFALLAAPLIDRIIRSVGSPRWWPRAGVEPGVLLFAFLVGLVLVRHPAVVSPRADDPAPGGRPGLLCVDPTRPCARTWGASAADRRRSSSRRRAAARFDLRDGAQQRLMSLMTSGGPADRCGRGGGDRRGRRAQARLALAGWDLVRGTMPAILVDRGLEAALAANRRRLPVPTT
jgi:hypothetical protein